LQRIITGKQCSVLPSLDRPSCTIYKNSKIFSGSDFSYALISTADVDLQLSCRDLKMFLYWKQGKHSQQKSRFNRAAFHVEMNWNLQSLSFPGCHTTGDIRSRKNYCLSRITLLTQLVIWSIPAATVMDDRTYMSRENRCWRNDHREWFLQS